MAIDKVKAINEKSNVLFLKGLQNARPGVSIDVARLSTVRAIDVSLKSAKMRTKMVRIWDEPEFLRRSEFSLE